MHKLIVSKIQIDWPPPESLVAVFELGMFAALQRGLNTSQMTSRPGWRGCVGPGVSVAVGVPCDGEAATDGKKRTKRRSRVDDDRHHYRREVRNERGMRCTGSRKMDIFFILFLKQKIKKYYVKTIM